MILLPLLISFSFLVVRCFRYFQSFLKPFRKLYRHSSSRREHRSHCLFTFQQMLFMSEKGKKTKFGQTEMMDHRILVLSSCPRRRIYQQQHHNRLCNTYLYKILRQFHLRRVNVLSGLWVVLSQKGGMSDRQRDEQHICPDNSLQFVLNERALSLPIPAEDNRSYLSGLLARARLVGDFQFAKGVERNLRLVRKRGWMAPISL